MSKDKRRTFYISTHATHKGGDGNELYVIRKTAAISTHATHKGGDPMKMSLNLTPKVFQLTPPIRVATGGKTRP